MIDSAGRSRRIDIITQNGGYKGGHVYIASIWGRAGVLPNYNGTLMDPVDTFADAFAIMELVKIRSMYVLPQNGVTNIILPASFSGFNVDGRNFAVALNGQYVDHTHFLAGHISGAFTGGPHFEHCETTSLTGPGCYMFDTAIDGVFTNTANDAIWLLNGAYTKTPGQEAVTFDFGVGKTNVALMLRHHSGGMHLHNMAAGHAMTAEGDGQLVVDANCTGGSISIRGSWMVTDNSGGAVTIIYDDSIQMLNNMDTSAELAGRFTEIKGAGWSASESLFQLVGGEGDTLKSLSDQISAQTTLNVVGGGGALPSYAEEGEQSKIVRGDVVDIPRYLTGDHTSYRLFFAAKANARYSGYAISVRECGNLTYDSVSDETSYTIPFVAADTESIDLGIYPSEVERRDSDGISNPVTPDRFGLDVVTQIIKPVA